MLPPYRSAMGLCRPPIRSDRSVSPEDQNREVHSATNSSMLENTTLVPCPTGTVSGSANSPPQTQEVTEGFQKPTTSPIDSLACRLESIQRQHTSVGVSDQATELLTAGWSKGTNTAYQSGWKRWYSWCDSRKGRSHSFWDLTHSRFSYRVV